MKRRREDDEVVAWAIGWASQGVTLDELATLDTAATRGALRSREGRERAWELGLLRPLQPDERLEPAGVAVGTTAATRPRQVGGPWQETAASDLWSWPLTLETWTPEVEESGGGAWPDTGPRLGLTR